jgi:hypothetical protein
LHLKPNMSFAGRRRVNKVKKGVQFTLMVVGAWAGPLLVEGREGERCY